MSESFLKKRMRERGLSNYGLAGKVAVSEGTIRQAALNGAGRLGGETLYKIAKELDTTVEDLLDEAPLGRSAPSTGQKLPICFKTGGGAWIETFDHADDHFGELEGTPLYAYRRCRQWYELLEGDSMNAMFPDGAFLHVIDAGDLAYEPRHGDVVIVERTRDGGFLRERSAKQIEIKGRSKIELWPRSTNPRWQKPITLNDHVDDETVTVAIVGLVARAVIDL